MKKIISGAAFLLCILSVAAQIQSKMFVPHTSFEKASLIADSLCRLMSVDEKISLIRGNNAIRSFPQYKIPAIYFTDASQGIKVKQPKEPGLKKFGKSTAFPNPLQLASTWNTSLSYNYAQAVAEEARLAGFHVLLGPGINIYRNSQCGRNFEYFGEDPFLVSRMTEQYVLGIQNTGVMATVKHFIANNTDLDRRKSNSIIDERALHEIYMPGFKAAIDAGVMSVMTSYNLLNGEWTGQSEYVINNLLRKDLGFKWLVMSDWTSVWEAEKIIRSGQDIEMPVGASLTSVKSLLDNGKVKIEQIDRMVKSILKTCIAMGFYDRGQQDMSLEKYDEHNKISLQTAREGIVLLKNRNDILPLRKQKRILLTGKYADSNAFGKGSGFVPGYNTISMRTALQNEFGDLVTYNGEPTDLDISKADCIILSVGTTDGEASDRPFGLPAEENERIKRVCSLNRNTIVVVNSGSGINMSSWNDKAAAILYAWYPGQIGQVALAEILSGKINPSGKLPITIERKFEDSPAYGYIPEGRTVKWPGSKNSPKTGDRSLIYDVNYTEGIFVGYRWFEHKNIEPLYHFGEGLSYTSFTYSDLRVDPRLTSEGVIKVTFQVKNTGKRDGSEIAQLYIGDKECSVERPAKELKGFQKFFLKKGETRTVTIQLSTRDFEFWHPEAKKWTFEPGIFRVSVGTSSKNSNLKRDISL